MSETALSGAKIGIINALPATYDQAGFEALTFDNGICALNELPTINRTADTIEISTLCDGLKRDINGMKKYDPMTYTLNKIEGDTAQATYEEMEDSDEVGSFKIIFPTGTVAYLTAVVNQFSITDGGDGNTLDMRSVTLLPQTKPLMVYA